MNSIIQKETFRSFLLKLDKNLEPHLDFLYDVYENIFNGINEINNGNSSQPTFNINSLELIFYMLGEFNYAIRGFDSQKIEAFKNDEKMVEMLSNVSADKYLSLSLYNHREEKLTNRYLPPISSLELYLNLMLNIVSRYPRNNPSNTLIVDLLTKSLSIARCTLTLLCDGYETEAFSMWRTLHECESVLIILDKYQDVAINAYLTHMEYGIAYKNGIKDTKKQDAIFEQIKKEMASLGLKSKDMKKFIEYGWLTKIDDFNQNKEFKLNFRDGLQSLAGLHQYASIYMTSSEILHSTPLLIYSNKSYFHYLTLLNLYESFFRIEKVFVSLLFQRIDDQGKAKYLEMRSLYYQQLINIHKREMQMFDLIKNK